jgi:hypothetical protein
VKRRLVGFEREFRIDADGAGRVRHLDQAVDQLAVAQLALILEHRWRQHQFDQALHARLAEGATRLLVRQDILQAHHLSRQIVNVLLRGVDDRESLLDVGHGRDCACRRQVEPFRQPFGNFGQA